MIWQVCLPISISSSIHNQFGYDVITGDGCDSDTEGPGNAVNISMHGEGVSSNNITSSMFDPLKNIIVFSGGGTDNQADGTTTNFWNCVPHMHENHGVSTRY